MKTFLALITMTVALVGLVFSPGAAVAVTFTVDTSVGWLDATRTCAEGGIVCVGTSGDGAFAGSSLTLNWDNTTGSQDSFLRMGALPGAFPSATAQTTIDPGQTQRVIQVQHENNVIPGADNFLGTITVRTLISLTEGGVTHDFPLDVDVTFIETDNDGSCLPGSTSNCDDVFTFIDLNVTIPFVHNGIQYEITFTGLLNADGTPACTPNGDGTVSCLTQEDQTNNRFVDISLRQVDVPVPATLLLLGLGLLVAGVHPLLRCRRAS